IGKKLILAGIACVLAAGLWLLVDGGERSRAEERVAVANPEESARPKVAKAAESSSSAAEPTGLAQPASEERAPARVVSADPDLAGLRGRVVERDGKPVAGVT